MNGSGPKKSGPNLKSFQFLVGSTLSPCQVSPNLAKILAMCLMSHHLLKWHNLSVFLISMCFQC